MQSTSTLLSRPARCKVPVVEAQIDPAFVGILLPIQATRHDYAMTSGITQHVVTFIIYRTSTIARCLFSYVEPILAKRTQAIVMSPCACGIEFDGRKVVTAHCMHAEACAWSRVPGSWIVREMLNAAMSGSRAARPSRVGFARWPRVAYAPHSRALALRFSAAHARARACAAASTARSLRYVMEA